MSTRRTLARFTLLCAAVAPGRALADDTLDGRIGSNCDVDTDCASPLICLGPRSSAIRFPANGFCTLDCTEDSAACEAQKSGARCIDFGLLSARPRPSSYCVEPCAAGTENAAKCHGRIDTACAGSACLPVCSIDLPCPLPRTCDPRSGLCELVPLEGTMPGAPCGAPDSGLFLPSTDGLGDASLPPKDAKPPFPVPDGGSVPIPPGPPVTPTEREPCAGVCRSGFCSRDCAIGRPGCPTGQHCVSYSLLQPRPTTGDLGTCLDDCKCDADCQALLGDRWRCAGTRLDTTGLVNTCLATDEGGIPRCPYDSPDSCPLGASKACHGEGGCLGLSLCVGDAGYGACTCQSEEPPPGAPDAGTPDAGESPDASGDATTEPGARPRTSDDGGCTIAGDRSRGTRLHTAALALLAAATLRRAFKRRRTA